MATLVEVEPGVVLVLVLGIGIGIEVARGVVDAVDDVTAIDAGAGCVGKGPSSTIGDAVPTAASGPPAADSPHAVEQTIAAMAQHDRQRFMDRNAMGFDRRSTGFTQKSGVDWLLPGERAQHPTNTAAHPSGATKWPPSALSGPVSAVPCMAAESW